MAAQSWLHGEPRTRSLVWGPFAKTLLYGRKENFEIDHYHTELWVCGDKAGGGGEAATSWEEVAGGRGAEGVGKGACQPKSQRFPSQPSSQMHCQGSTQSP